MESLKKWKWFLTDFYEHFDEYPLKRLLQLRFVLSTTLKMIGVGFLDKDWRFNALTVAKLCIVVSFAVFFAYTAWIYIDQSVMLLQVFCCQGVYVPNTIKLYIGLKKRHALCSFADFGEHLYLSNEKSELKSPSLQSDHKSERMIFMRYCITSSYQTLLGMIMATLLALNLFTLFPSYMWMVKKNYVWIIPILVPFTSLDTMKEFYLNITVQLIFSSSAMVSAMCMDLFFALCTCHHGTATILIEQSIHELNLMYINNKDSKHIRNAKLINIIRQFQDLHNFASKMNKTFGNILLAQPLATSLSTILSLFCIMANSWYAGIGYITFTYTTFLAICYVGQSVQNNNQNLLKVLSNSEWHLLPICDQRLFLFALMGAQRAPEFWIGPFAPYNMETASHVTQKIYSYAMMLLRIQN